MVWIHKQDDVDLFSLVSIIVIFVFYCIPQSKRSVYLMPIYPFIAYFITQFILWLEQKKRPVLKIYGGILASLGILLFICLIVVKCGIIPEDLFGSGRHAVQNVMMLHALEDIGGFGWVLALVPCALGFCWFCLSRKDIISVMILTFGIYLALDGLYTPTILNVKSVKQASAEINRFAPASQGVLYEYMEAGVKAKGDPVHFFEVNFYLGNRIESFHLQKPAKGFLLILKQDSENNFPEFQKEGYRFKQLYEEPKRQMQVYEFLKESL